MKIREVTAPAPKPYPDRSWAKSDYDRAHKMQVDGAVDIYAAVSTAEYSVFFDAPINYPDITDGLPSQDVELNALVPTQNNVMKTERYEGNDIYVVRWFGKNYVVDGHHRYMWALSKKRKTIGCVVLDLGENRWKSLESAITFMQKATGVKLGFEKRKSDVLVFPV